MANQEKVIKEVMSGMEPLENILLTTKRLELDEVRREIRKIVRATGMSADKVLAGLDEERLSLRNCMAAK